MVNGQAGPLALRPSPGTAAYGRWIVARRTRPARQVLQQTDVLDVSGRTETRRWDLAPWTPALLVTLAQTATDNAKTCTSVSSVKTLSAAVYLRILHSQAMLMTP